MKRRPYTHVNHLGTIEAAVCDSLRRRGPSDIVEIVNDLAISPRQVQTALAALLSAGKIERTWCDGYGVYQLPKGQR